MHFSLRPPRLPHRLRPRRRRSLFADEPLLALAGLAAAAYGLSKINFAPNFFVGKVVVIAGGSRGLGLAIARRLRREGATLALLARDTAELDRAAQDLRDGPDMPAGGGEVFTHVCDLTEPDTIPNAVAAVAERFGGIDILINDAGTIIVGPLEHLRLQDFDDAMRLHFYGVLRLIWETLPHLRGRRDARIVNIASIGGKVAVPHLAPYSASKFALVGLSDALRNELAKDGIRVTTVCPGLIRTGSHVNALFKGQHDKEFDWFSTSNSFPLASVSAERAAREVVEACRRGRPALTFPLQTRAAEVFYHAFPNLAARVLAFVNRYGLPAPNPNQAAGDELREGRASRVEETTPAWKTALSDEAAKRNNE